MLRDAGLYGVVLVIVVGACAPAAHAQNDDYLANLRERAEEGDANAQYDFGMRLQLGIDATRDHFWATWCGLCITALPALRQLVEDLPADRFALLAISVDEEIETVRTFLETEAMPWSNWHAGLADELFLHRDLRGYPTYVLADENGAILARTHDLDDRLEALIRATVERAGAVAGA